MRWKIINAQKTKSVVYSSSGPLSLRTRFRSFVLIAFVLLTALSLPPTVRGTTTYSDVFPSALSNYSYGGWQGPFGDGTAGRLFPTSDGTGIYADATYNGLVWTLRSSPEFSSIDMTMHFSIPNRDFTDADYFALLLILHSPTTPSSTPPGTNCDGTCSYVAGQSGFKVLYRIGFNQLVITNGPGNVTLSQIPLPPVALNQPHDARATYAAGNLTIYLDSVQLVTLQTTNLPAGQIGFETYRTDLIVSTITLVGSPVPGFALSINPASARIGPNPSTNATIVISSVSGFSGTVALSATALTSSLTASLNPSSIVLAPGSNLTSTLTVNASSFCGNQTVTVTGTSGSATGSVTFTVTGQCTFDFSLADSPATLTIVQGGPSGVETATATLLTGLATPITFSITTPIPTGVTASAFTPASCSPTCSPTVTLTASVTAPGSTTTLFIQAAGSGVTRTAAFSLVVVPPGTFDFSLAVRPSTLSIIHGEASGLEIVSTTLLVGATTPVTFSIATALPTGVTAYPFAPTSCSPSCSTSVTLTASATAPPSTTTLTIQAVGGGVTRTATFDLVITCNTGGSIDFCLAATPSTLTIVPGGPSGVETVSATLLGGTTTPVTFNNLTVLPTGVTASVFTPASCSPTCSATWTFTASPSAPASTRILYISATGGGVTSPANFTLVVQQCTCQISLAPSPSTLTIIPGGAGETETVSATLVAGVAPFVTFSITSPLPTGVGAGAFTPVSCIPTCSATVMLTASSTSPGSNTTMTIQATGGGITRTTTFNLVVTCGTGGAFDLCLATTPSTLTIFPGGPGGVETVTATLLAGSTTPMTFSIPNPLPLGVTASAFTPVSCNPTCSATVTLTASSTAPFDTSTVVTISATGGGLTRTAAFTLFVAQGISDYTIAWSPTSATIAGGSITPNVVATLTNGIAASITCTVSLPSPAVTGLSASPLTFSITPAVAPGAAQAVTISTTTLTPLGTYTIGVSCTSGIGNHTANFSLTFTGGGAFDYAIAWSPTSASVATGASTTPGIVATLTSGASASVTCTTGLPSPAVTGLSASPLSFSITPQVAPGASQDVTISTTTLTPAGTYTIRVSCTGGVGTHTSNFALTVSAGAFDYAVAWSPTSAFITAPSGTTPNVVATLTTGATTSISCTVTVPVATGLAASPTSFSITPAAAPGAAHAVAITTTTSTPVGGYSIYVSCSGGIGSHTASFSLTVSVVIISFAWNPTSATIAAGASTTPNVVATLTGGTAGSFTCTVSVPVVTGLSASPLSFSITPAPSPGATQPVVISTTSATPSGTYTIGVSCTSGIGSHSANFALTLCACFGPTVAWSPTSATIVAGSSTVPNVVATLTSGTATPLACTVSVPVATGLAASPLTFSITPAAAPGATQPVFISTTAVTPVDTYIISVSCTSGVGSRIANLVLTVQNLQDIDGDGIFDNVDTQPTVFSNDFSDIPLGGTTFGTILSKGDQCPSIPCQLTIQEVSSSTGILITASPTGGLTPASISVCGGASILSVSAGDSLTVKCGSVTIAAITGAVIVTFVGSGSNAGITGTATITAGNGITFQPPTFVFTAPPTNTATITITINGNTLPIAPGQTALSPFAIFTVSVVNPSGQAISAGIVLKFDGSASFATIGPITSYTWNFGDGTILSNGASKVTHTYAVNGTYTVSLIVADNFGNSNSQSNTLNVLPAPIAGSETFSHNLYVSGDRLVQNVTVQITNPNPYPILVNVKIAGNCDTICPFSDQSGPIFLAAGQTKYISVVHTFTPLDQGQTFVMQVTVSFSTNISNMDLGTYILASSRTFSFTIK